MPGTRHQPFGGHTLLFSMWPLGGDCVLNIIPLCLWFTGVWFRCLVKPCFVRGTFIIGFFWGSQGRVLSIPGYSLGRLWTSDCLGSAPWVQKICGCVPLWFLRCWSRTECFLQGLYQLSFTLSIKVDEFVLWVCIYLDMCHSVSVEVSGWLCGSLLTFHLYVDSGSLWACMAKAFIHWTISLVLHNVKIFYPLVVGPSYVFSWPIS